MAGEAVNFTSRIGKASSSNKVNISAMTYELVKEFFSCGMLGDIPVKYKGFVEVYQVDGILPQLEDAEHKGKKNKTFDVKYSLIQFLDIQEEVLDMMEQNLPENLFYHNIKHTIDVVTEVELIGWAEGLSEEEILMVKLAALFHDSGHVISYDEHELHGTVIARNMLAKYDFSDDMMATICDLIMATKFPPEPKNILEKVICDSDLDYLGRTDFIPVSNMLYEELKVRNMIGSFNEWNQRQLTFIRKHQYYTNTAQHLREVNKNKQIERLELLLASASMDQ
nr:HD domain-containing protein [Saccharicrinis fermentans]